MKRFKAFLSVIFLGFLLSGLLVGCEEKECTHSDYKWVTTKEATCTAEGIKERRCADCDELLETVTISKKSHDYGGWFVDVESTCSTNGSKHHKCKNCGYTESLTMAKDSKVHTWSEWVVDKEATCEEDGQQTHECTGCHTTETETIEATGHTWGEWFTDESTGVTQRECSVCHKTEYELGGCEHRYEDLEKIWGDISECNSIVSVSYKCPDCGEIIGSGTSFVGHVYENGHCKYCNREEPGKGGQTVTFGTYPQTRVTDTTTLNALNALVIGLPTAGQASGNGWTSYNYYNSEGEISHFMWYQDVNYGGNKYRAVYFTEKRSASTNEWNEPKVISNDLSINTVYWYKWEPLTWTVIENMSDSQLMICNQVIDAQFYQEYTKILDVEDSKKYSSSNLLTWFENVFISMAFSGSEEAKLLVDEQYLLIREFVVGNWTNEQLLEKTTSKIRIPTASESSGCSATDYAVCQGALETTDARFGNAEYSSFYLLDTGDYMDAYSIGTKTGTTYTRILNYSCDINGVVPVIRISK